MVVGVDQECSNCGAWFRSCVIAIPRLCGLCKDRKVRYRDVTDEKGVMWVDDPDSSEPLSEEEQQKIKDWYLNAEFLRHLPSSRPDDWN